MSHPYIPATEEDLQEMLQAIGVSSFEELLEDVPPEARLKGPLRIPEGISEEEVRRLVEGIAEANRRDLVIFAGAGAYDHFIPAAIGHILSRSEYYTAYTPYQAEVAQGTLQAMFEYQTAICELTGMEVANSSMYDGASALAEAALMALRIRRDREKILLPGNLNPLWRQVVLAYLHGQKHPIEEVPYDPETGQLDLEALRRMADDRTAGVVIQHPNFFGVLEEVREITEIVRNSGAVFIVAFDPISLGILEPPGAYGADIAVGEGQPLGLPLGFGGPYLGIFASRMAYIRQMPGRIAGQTVDVEGKRGFVMALQTREQHIRREKATSNICTNQMLCALTALIYLSLMGPQGIRAVAEGSALRAHYLARKLTEVPGVELAFQGPFFREFALTLPLPAHKVIERGLEQGYLLGVDLAPWGFPENRLLVAVTERRTREELDRFAEILREVAR